jgi:ABC-2 type transport system permease protein
VRETLLTLIRYYPVGTRLGFQHEFQYRARAVFGMIGFLVEPTVYLAVWTEVAEAGGGEVGGYSSAQLAAYYIVWTLVRVFNVAYTPYGWEWRIRGGRLNDLLSQPLHPFHRDFSFFGGQKVVWVGVWFPVAVLLTLTFRPALSPTPVEVLGFALALWGAFAVRFVVLYLLGMLTFWTTRASAPFEMVVAAELVLSGRLVPLELMPPWVERVAMFLPFRWSFQFPIETLIGRLSTGEILGGLALQLLWAVGLGAVLALVWRRAIRRYAAVGG